MRWKAAECTKCDLFCDRPIRVKGPGLRIDLDVRRMWRCAKCGKTVRTPVQVVSQRCSCSDAPWMTLQPPVKREPFRPPLREPLPEEDPVAEQAVAVTIADPAPIVGQPPVTSPVTEALPAAAPDTVSENPAKPALSVTESVAVPPVPAAVEPARSTPVANHAPHAPPADDFGAGLDDAAPGPPA